MRMDNIPVEAQTARRQTSASRIHRHRGAPGVQRAWILALPIAYLSVAFIAPPLLAAGPELASVGFRATAQDTVGGPIVVPTGSISPADLIAAATGAEKYLVSTTLTVIPLDAGSSSNTVTFNNSVNVRMTVPNKKNPAKRQQLGRLIGRLVDG